MPVLNLRTIELCADVTVSAAARWGPSIKYVTLEGVREGVTVCDRREGVQEHVTSHFSYET